MFAAFDTSHSQYRMTFFSKEKITRSGTVGGCRTLEFKVFLRIINKVIILWSAVFHPVISLLLQVCRHRTSVHEEGEAVYSWKRCFGRRSGRFRVK